MCKQNTLSIGTIPGKIPGKILRTVPDIIVLELTYTCPATEKQSSRFYAKGRVCHLRKGFALKLTAPSRAEAAV